MHSRTPPMSGHQLRFVCLAQSTGLQVAVACAEILRAGIAHLIGHPILAIGLHDDVATIGGLLDAAVCFVPFHDACRHIRLGMSYQIPSVPCLPASCNAKQLGSCSAMVFSHPRGSVLR